MRKGEDAKIDVVCEHAIWLVRLRRALEPRVDGVALGVDGDDAVKCEHCFAQRACFGVAVARAHPAVETRPAVQVAARRYHGALHGVEADVALKVVLAVLVAGVVSGILAGRL